MLRFLYMACALALSTPAFAADNPAQVAPPTTPAKPAPKPQPAFEKGKPFALFPADRSSEVTDYVSPLAENKDQKSGIKEAKYPGWTWGCGKQEDMTGFSVQKGELEIKTMGAFSLDGFPSTQFDLSFELQIGAGSLLAVQAGSGREGINLVAIDASGVAPGTWDQTKQQGGLNVDAKKGKPHNVKPGGWMTVRILLVNGNLEVFCNNKSVWKGAPLIQVQNGQFGFLCLGENNNQKPTWTIKNVVITTPP